MMNETWPPDDPEKFDEEDGDLQAVREAVSEWRAGDEGLPLKEAFEELRRMSYTD